MPADTSSLSDRALAVFAFAAYHELESGQPVKKVIRQDGKGHQADEEAVKELEAGGFVSVDGNDIAFSESGLTVLKSSIDGLKSSARQAA